MNINHSNTMGTEINWFEIYVYGFRKSRIFLQKNLQCDFL